MIARGRQGTRSCAIRARTSHEDRRAKQSPERARIRAKSYVQVKCRTSTFFGRATPDHAERVPTASNVGWRDVTWAAALRCLLREGAEERNLSWSSDLVDKTVSVILSGLDLTRTPPIFSKAFCEREIFCTNEEDNAVHESEGVP